MINIDLIKQYITEIAEFNIDETKKSSSYSVQMSIFSGMYRVIYDDINVSRKDISEDDQFVYEEFIRVYKEKNDIYNKMLNREMNEEVAKCNFLLELLTKKPAKEEPIKEESIIETSTEEINEDGSIDLSKQPSLTSFLLTCKAVDKLTEIKTLEISEDEQLKKGKDFIHTIIDKAHNYIKSDGSRALSPSGVTKYTTRFDSASDIEDLIKKINSTINAGRNYKNKKE